MVPQVEHRCKQIDFRLIDLIEHLNLLNVTWQLLHPTRIEPKTMKNSIDEKSNPYTVFGRVCIPIGY